MYKDKIEIPSKFIRGEMTIWELVEFFDSTFPFPESEEKKEEVK